MTAKYYPIEISTILPIDEKIKGMIAWWSESHEEIIKLNLTRNALLNIVRDTAIEFREGLHNVVKYCGDHNIPFLVFSAGLYDVITPILQDAGLKPPAVHVVSNRMIFSSDDPEGVIIGFKDPLIHTFNKNESSVANTPYAENVYGRHHVVCYELSLNGLI